MSVRVVTHTEASSPEGAITLGQEEAMRVLGHVPNPVKVYVESTLIRSGLVARVTTWEAKIEWE